MTHVFPRGSGHLVSDTGLSGQKHSARKNVQLIQVFGLYYNGSTFAHMRVLTYCVCVCLNLCFCLVGCAMYILVCLFTARTLHKNTIATQTPEQTPLT